jgi:hypothetical protein
LTPMSPAHGSIATASFFQMLNMSERRLPAIST